jgi:hypothetical protein
MKFSYLFTVLSLFLVSVFGFPFPEPAENGVYKRVVGRAERKMNAVKGVLPQ